MSSFETQVETTTPPPEPKKESSDALGATHSLH